MKIAIITHYYGSKNYGGNLQAYALCKVLNQMGMQAEQISFERYSNKKGSKITSPSSEDAKISLAMSFSGFCVG